MDSISKQKSSNSRIKEQSHTNRCLNYYNHCLHKSEYDHETLQYSIDNYLAYDNRKQYLQKKENIENIKGQLYNELDRSHSACSCCSYYSSVADKEVLDSDTNLSSFPSTACTTPINYRIILKDDEESADVDCEKIRVNKFHAVEELLQTERDYVNDLSYLVEICLDTLNNQVWISPEHRSIITRNSKEILTFHKQFIVYYDTISVYDNNWDFIARRFLEQIDNFSVYKPYCDLHSEAWNLITVYREKPEWSQFLKDCAIMNTYSIPLNLSSLLKNDFNHIPDQPRQQQKRLSFEDYLIKPVQRICRYQLLIKKIVNYTPYETSEHDLWTRVLRKMEDIVTEIDERKFQREIQERTSRFIDRLEGDWRIRKRHVLELGNIMMAGAIEVTYSALGHTVSKPKYLGCFIFPTYIIMVQPKKGTLYEPKHWFPLKLADFEDLVNAEGQKEHLFIIRCKKHTFAFNASCSLEKQVWTQKIQEAIAIAKSKDDKMLVHDFIIPSFFGTKKNPSQYDYLSHSFTDGTYTQSAENSESNQTKSQTCDEYFHSDIKRPDVKRSLSTSVHFSNTTKSPFASETDKNKRARNFSATDLKKRQSLDYSMFGIQSADEIAKYLQSCDEEKQNKLNSQRKQRPNSLILLSNTAFNTAINTNTKIGKMSFQFKNTTQSSDQVDFKLQDVCTQDYLSSRAWFLKDRGRDKSQYTATAEPTIHNHDISNSVSGCASESIKTNVRRKSLLKRRKSSASNAKLSGDGSTIKRIQDVITPTHQEGSGLNEHNALDTGVHPSKSLSSDRKKSFLDSTDSHEADRFCHHLDRYDTNKSESAGTYKSDRTDKRTLENQPEVTLTRRKSLVQKVVRKIASFHLKANPSSTPDQSGEHFKEKTELPEKIQGNSVSPEYDILESSSNAESIAFSYAITPPPPSDLSFTKKAKKSKWKDKFSLIRLKN